MRDVPWTKEELASNELIMKYSPIYAPDGTLVRHNIELTLRTPEVIAEERLDALTLSRSCQRSRDHRGRR